MRIRRLVDFQALTHSLSDIYSTKNDEAKGRLISLGSALTAAFYNVFITGIFYTGFLSMYDISITGVGIVSFIPYIASCFSIFSSSYIPLIVAAEPELYHWFCLYSTFSFNWTHHSTAVFFCQSELRFHPNQWTTSIYSPCYTHSPQAFPQDGLGFPLSKVCISSLL